MEVHAALALREAQVAFHAHARHENRPLRWEHLARRVPRLHQGGRLPRPQRRHPQALQVDSGHHLAQSRRNQQTGQLLGCPSACKWDCYELIGQISPLLRNSRY